MALASGSSGSRREPKRQSKSLFNPQSDHRVYQGSIQPKSFPPLPSHWVSEWETFPSSDGVLQLFSVTHHPKDWKGHRVLMIFHGFGEHGGRYLHFPHFLNTTVDAVCCLDHRGHGRSEGLRGHISNFDLFADDLALAVSRVDEHLRKRFGDSEIHVLGHSMGGLITLKALFKHSSLPIRSVTVSSPLFRVRVPIPPLKRLVGRAMAKVWGSLHMTSDLNPIYVSRDKDVVETYITDRLVHNKITPQFFSQLEIAMEDTWKKNSGFNFPLQLMIPLQDEIVDSEMSLQFFRNLKLRDKLLKTYPGFYHEPFNELGKEQVFEDLELWIKSHSVNSSDSSVN